mgnify:CR=1 FL=1
MTITWDEFQKVEMRIGTIIDAQEFPEAIKPAYKLVIDLGEKIGIKKSSAQITDLYSTKELIGKQVIAVVNFPPKKITSFSSEVLILGAKGQESGIVLLELDTPIQNGAKIS